MAKQEKVFADGFSFKRPEQAPDFVAGRMNIKVVDAIAFLKQHEENGWVSLNVNKARSGNYYVELDTFKPTKGGGKGKTKSEPVTIEDESEDLPF